MVICFGFVPYNGIERGIRMGRKTGWRKLGVWMILAVLIGWPLYRIYGYLSQSASSYDATLLLYQVAQFQVELLNSSLSEASKAGTTDELDSLRVTAYSANFAHERLVMAVGKERIANLHSIQQLVQAVIRLQIGGDRALKPEEKEAFVQAEKLFKPMYEGYGKLLTSSGKPVSSQNDKLKKLDAELDELLRKRILQ